MLRKSRARSLASLTAAVVVLLAALFAALRNLNAPVAPAAAPIAMPRKAGETGASATRGPQAFVRLGCASCHAFGGVGNPSSPLDGVASRMDATQIRAWASGTGVAAGELPARIVRRKVDASADPDFEALLAWLGRGP